MGPVPVRSDTLAIRKGIGVHRSEAMNELIHAAVEMVVEAASSEPHLTTASSRPATPAAEFKRYA